MSKHRTQVDRVVAAARSYRGITAVDFLGPNTIDGGPPITRVAARLWDAEQDGFSFECIGKRDRCKVFRLCGEPDIEGSGGGGSGGFPSSSDPSAVALGTGVEGGSGDLLPDGSPRSSTEEPPAVALSSGRLFDMEPEHVGHYDERDIAA